uniref:Uncharacterized protein n=1 Tax=Octopus bimaculoides TaxID=37653 RepID=A0A0L8GKR7_OCTBM
MSRKLFQNIKYILEFVIVPKTFPNTKFFFCKKSTPTNTIMENTARLLQLYIWECTLSLIDSK